MAGPSGNINRLKIFTTIVTLLSHTCNTYLSLSALEKAIKEAAEEFYKDPMGVPSLSPWITVRSVLPKFSEKFAAYVEKDNA